MMEWTTRHYRVLARLLTRRTRLYTEMFVDSTLLHSPLARAFLRFSPEERPVACQLGGSVPANLAAAARLVEEMGYDEVNLNCGCPSPRVAGKGCFGAALMHTPELVRDCVAAMRAAVSIPVTVKCRLGVDSLDSYEAFRTFVVTVAAAGCEHFIVHARKCLLKGLDPKGNRTVPPLRYAWVQRVALEFPHLRFSLNGGVTEWVQAEQLLALERHGKGGSGAGGGTEGVGEDGVSGGLPAWGDAADGEPGVEFQTQPHRGVGCGGCGACDDSSSEEDGARAGARAAACSPTSSSSSSPSSSSSFSPLSSPSPRATNCATAEAPQEALGSPAGAAVPFVAGAPLTDEGSRNRKRFQLMRAQRAAREAAAARMAPEQFFLGTGDPSGGTGGAVEDPLGAAAAERGVRRTAPVPERFGVRGRAVLDSVMVGRAAYNNCWMLADADRRAFGQRNPGLSRREVVLRYLAYCEAVRDRVPPDEAAMPLYRTFELVKPLIGLFNGEFGGARFRTQLSVLLQEEKKGIREAVEEALRGLPDEVLDSRAP